MISFVWRSDAHLADQPPQSRVDDWAATILGKLVQVGEIARQASVSAVLDGGDLFHIKSPSRTSHELMQRVAEIHRAYPCPTLGNVGNHDVKYGDIQYLSEAPLGVLFKSRVILPCFDQMEMYFGQASSNNSASKLYPYNRKEGGWLRGNPFGVHPRQEPIVRVVGIPYHGTSYNTNRFTTITKGEEDFLVVMVHCLASAQGGTMFEAEDIVHYEDLKHLDPDVWCFLPGTKVLDWNDRALSIEDIREPINLAGRVGIIPIKEVHPVRHVDEDVVVFDVEGIPSDLVPGVTREHPFWVAKGLRCRLPSRASRRCHPEKPSVSSPCLYCHDRPKVSPVWCPAGSIEPGDYMAVPVPQLIGDRDAPGLARLLGLYVAEGHIIQNRNKQPVAGVGWSFHDDETRLQEDVRVLVGEHFGLTTHSYTGSTGHCVQVCAHGAQVADFFLANGGRHAATKSFSDWVWLLSPASRMECLIGWLDGDGHARNPARYGRIKAEVMGATVSPQLATQ